MRSGDRPAPGHRTTAAAAAAVVLVPVLVLVAGDVALAAEAPAAAAAPAGEAWPPPPPVRVPLAANFSRFEQATTAMAVVAGVGVLAFGERMFGLPAPSLGPPAPTSFDRRWSERLYMDDGSGGRFLGRAPDLAGLFVFPYLPGVIYGVDAILMAAGGARRIFPGDPNPDHRLVAYAEALGWTVLVTGMVKVLVGRERPYVVLDHPELQGTAREANLSFFSSHSSAMFAAASFVALDASRRLGAGPLAGAPPARRWLLGTALPYLACFGAAALVGVSRVIDQQHWPSDVLVGSLVGAGIAHLAYLTHFDGHGRPRGGRAAGTTDWRLAPTPYGIALWRRLP
jgi:membrane-associated phospholipid phosphatase